MHPEDPTRKNDPLSPGHAKLNEMLSMDEHVEEGLTRDGRRVRRFGIYLLPNLITTGTLFAGFVILVSALRGNYEVASFAMFFAMVCDGLDGRIARLSNAQSRFGVEYDSLSDMVAFGVAPALVLFSWAEPPLGKGAWAVSFIFMAAAALRLARFNSRASGEFGRKLFQGMPSPPAAALVMFMVWNLDSHGITGSAMPPQATAVVVCVTLFAALLMVSNISYLSFKELLSSRGRVPFAFLLFLVLLLGVVMLDPQRVLLGMASTYFLSGPVVTLYHAIGRRLKPTKPAQ